METKNIYEFDEEGFFVQEVLFQVLEGVYPPANCTETPLPEASAEENFFRWDGSQWLLVPKPKTAEDLDGVVVPHESQTRHNQELRQLMQTLTQNDETYRLVRGADLSWSVEKITDEETLAQEAQAALQEFDRELQSLKDRLSLAMLMGDQEQVEALRTEYAALMTR